MTTKTNESVRPPMDASIAELQGDIEHTRQEMGATLSALESRLNPGALSEKANAELDHLEARVKSALKEGIEEAKAAASVTVNESIDHAKEAVAITVKESVQEAKEAVAHTLKEAREAVRKDVQDAITHTKHSAREATLGRVEELATKAGDVMNETRETLVETIRRNPVPAVLTGIGIAWLLMNRSSASRARNGSSNGYNPYRGMGYGPDSPVRSGGLSGVGEAFVNAEHAVARTAGNVAHRVGDVAGQIGGSVGQVAGQVSGAVGHAGQVVAGAAHNAGTAAMGAIGSGAETATHLAHDAEAAAGRMVHAAADAANELAHSAQEMAGSVAGTARDQARRVEGGLASAWESNPLAFGAAALVAGAAVGFALPRTDKEDQLLGEARDQMVHDVADRAAEAVHSLQHLAEGAGKAAKDAVKASTV